MAKFTVGLFDREESMFNAIKSLNNQRIKIKDVFTPYPVHGLDDAIGLKRSRLPRVAFGAGFLGATFAMAFQIWSLTAHWAHNIGGKPGAAFLSFIPVTFEVMVLSAALSMVTAFFLSEKLYPRFCIDVFELRATDDLLVVAVDQSSASNGHREIEGIFKENGAIGVKEKEGAND